RTKVKQHIKGVLSDLDQPDHGIVHRIVRQDGDVRYVRMQTRSLYDGEGESKRIRMIVGTLLDITAQRESEQKLKQARREAEAASESKSAFLANMSHEIRTPMTAILGYADVLSARIDDPDAQSCLHTIKENGTYLCEILNDILDLSRIEAGKMIIHREPVSVVDILADIRSLMAVRAMEKSLSLSMHVKSRIPETIFSDPTKVRQILVNLVGNAIKFTQKGEVRIETRYLPEHKVMEFAVVDTGTGISQEDAESLFQAFEQVDNSLTREVGGSGLGLAICRRLVSMLGGELTVESELGKGSTFRFTVETGELENVNWIEQGTEVFRNEDQREPKQLPNIAGRVLAIDDRPEIRFLVREYVEAAGGTVEGAKNGKEGVEIWIQGRDGNSEFDAVLIDIQMPVMDGYEATRKLRAEGYRGPIIALTANAMTGDREKCLEAGCDDFVSKPIDRTELVRKLAEWLNTSNGKQEDSDQDSLAILLVDDRKAALLSQRMLLEQLGHRVETAASGEAALQLLDDFYPDVCLLDLGLAGMSGGELLQQMKLIPSLSDCVFVCLTGRDEQDIDWREMGFDHFLQKPAPLEDLQHLLGAAKRD
ncbi:MAG: response regulator, partial [Planctomycetaceae bacterium]|nr:response regulator [Planctomycetaceae bacterium]